MPRQLPWANRGGGNRTVVLKQPPKAAAKARQVTDFDDGFFEGTVLATEPRDSEDELPTLNKDGRISRRDKGKDPIGRPRMPSSSPPPSAELPPPEIEYMDKGVDKFDLRDDEWMMVEDELLQTAKLFTRHLHLAEYKRMKATIDEKRKNGTVETPRPVVAGARPSVQAQFKDKAEKQVAAQNAFLDAQDEHAQNETPVKKTAATFDVTAKTTRTDIPEKAPKPTISAEPIPRAPVPTHTASKDDTTSESDSDDLDAPKRRPKKYTAPKSPSPPPPPKEPPKPTFVKPALPPTANARARARAAQASRANKWDDDPDPKPTPSFTPQRRSSPPAQAQSTTPARRPSRSTDPWDAMDEARKGDVVPKETPSERIAKRKVEVDSVKGTKNKAVKKDVDDIPTFLF